MPALCVTVLLAGGCRRLWPYTNPSVASDSAANVTAADGGEDGGPKDAGPEEEASADISSGDTTPGDTQPMDASPEDLVGGPDGAHAACLGSLTFVGSTVGTLAVDTLGRPHALSAGGGHALQHHYPVAANWTAASVAEGDPVGAMAAAVDGAGVLHLLYLAGSELRLRRLDVSGAMPGSWSSTTIVAKNVGSAELALAAEGDLVIGQAFFVDNGAKEFRTTFRLDPAQGYTRQICDVGDTAGQLEPRLAISAQLVARTAHDSAEGMTFAVWNRPAACSGAAPLLGSVIKKFSPRPLAVAVDHAQLHLGYASPGLSLQWQGHTIGGGVTSESPASSDRPEDLALALDDLGRPHLVYGHQGKAWWTYRVAKSSWATPLNLGVYDGRLHLVHRAGVLHMLLASATNTFYRCLTVPTSP